MHADSDRDRAILSLVHLAEIGGCLYEDAPTRVNGPNVNDAWWNGITLGGSTRLMFFQTICHSLQLSIYTAPSREKQGLLPNLNLNLDSKELFKKFEAEN